MSRAMSLLKATSRGAGQFIRVETPMLLATFSIKTRPNCATTANPDSCAQTAIANKKDELRLAARNNIILGDYTETTDGVTRKTWQGLQSADYYRSQFGFNTTDPANNI
jgi:hypothetical protein